MPDVQPSLKPNLPPDGHRSLAYLSQQRKLSTLLREISWTNSLIIMNKAKSDEKKEFYMRLCINERLKTRKLPTQTMTSSTF